MLLKIEPELSAVAPGDVVDLLVRVSNDGEAICHPVLSVRGVDPDDVLVPDEVVAVAPGHVMTAVVRLRAGRDALAGDLRVGLGVTDASGVQSPVSAATVLRVGARPDVALEVDPAATTGRRGAKATTVLRNRSDRRVRVDLEARGDGVALRFRPPSVVLDPGEMRHVRTRLRPTVRSWFGERRHGAIITARGVGLPVATTVTFTQRPTIPRAGIRGVAALAALAVWVAATVFVFQWINAEDAVEAGSTVVAPVAPGPGTTSASLIVEPEASGPVVPVVIRGTVEGPRTPAGTTVTAERISFGDEGTTEGPTKLVALAGVKLPRGSVLDVVAVTTDERGRFRIASGLVEDAFYRVTVARGGFDVSSRILATSEEARDIELVVTLDPATGALSGSVTDTADAPIGEATVTVTDGTATYRATTGTEGADAGRWSLEGLSTPADYQVVVARRGFAAQTLILTLDGGQARDDVDVTMPTALGSLRGRVTALDPDSGLPAGVGAIDIVLEGEEGRTTTTLTGSAALTGSFDLPALPFGAYQITFSGDGWRTQQAEVVVGSGDVVFDTRLLRASGIVQGYVRQTARLEDLTPDDSTDDAFRCRYPTPEQRDEATAQPCGGALVSLTSEEGDVFATATATIGSATQGLYRIDGVPAGEYTLRASSPGYVDHTERIVLGPGETRSVRGSGDTASLDDLEDDPIILELVAAPMICTGTIEIGLSDLRTGDPIATDARDDISLPGGLACEDDVSPVVERVSGLNVYQISNAPLGRTTVTVDHAGFELLSVDVDVNSFDNPRETVRLAPFTSLGVTLTDTSGSTVEGAEVIVFPASGTPGTNPGAGVTACTRIIAADGAFAGEEVSGLCATTGSDGEASLPQALGLGTWRVSTPVNTTVTDTALDFRPTLLGDVVSVTANTAGATQSVSGTLQRFASLTGQVFVFDPDSGAFVAGDDDLFGESLEDFPDLATDGQGIQLELSDGTAFPAARTPRLTYSVSGGIAAYRIDRIQPDESGVTRTYVLTAAVFDDGTPRQHVIGTGDLGGFAYDEVRTGIDLRLREPDPVPVTVSVREAEALGTGGPARVIAGARVRITGSAGFDQQRPPTETVETCPSPTCTGFVSDANDRVVTDGGELWLTTDTDGETPAISGIFTAGAESTPLTIEAEATGYRTLDLPTVGTVSDATVGPSEVEATVTLPFDTVTLSGTVNELVTTADSTATAALADATVSASVTVTVGGTTYARSTTAASDGTYSLTLPVGYEWTVNATLDDYAYAAGSAAIVRTTASGVDLTGQDLTLERTSGVVLRGDVTVDSGDEVEVRVFSDPTGTTQLGASYFIGAGGEFVFPTVLPAGSVYRVEFHVGSDAAAASASTSATATRWIDANSTPAGIEPATVLLEQDVSDGSTATVTVRVVNPAADSATVNVELSEIGPFPTLGPDGELPTQNVAVGSDGQEDVAFEAVPLRGSDRSILADRLRLNVTVPSGFVIDDITVGPDSLTSDSDGRLITDIAHAGGVTVVVSLAGSPGAPTIDSITPDDEELEIAFTLNSVDGGRSIDDVEYSTDDAETWTAFTLTTSPGTITGLDNGTAYDVQIRAVNNIGPSAASVAATATPRTVPGAPTITSIVEGDGQLSVAFTDPVSDGGATITNYQYSTDDGSNWTVRSPSSDASPIEISALANGTTYRVRIRAVNDAGPGAASAAQSASPQAPFAVATGGSTTCERSDGTTVDCDDSYAAFKVHTFAGTSAGAGTTETFTVTSAPPAAFDIWVIGGGGAGGTGPNSNDGGGGGGGGGSAYAAGASLSAGSFTVTAGAGGAKPTTTGTGAAGAASSLTDSSGSVLIRATGANGGTATTGGAGGNASAGTLSYTAGQGGTGGAGNVGSGSNGSNGGAGGGGGGDGSSAVGGSGGYGSSIGARLFSGGGGGGATDMSGSGTSTPAQGGSGFGDGGAGNGLQSSNTSAEDGGGTVGGAGGSAGASRVNSGGGGGAYGGGGGGGADFNLGGGLGGGGGGGVVIIRYAIS